MKNRALERAHGNFFGLMYKILPLPRSKWMGLPGKGTIASLCLTAERSRERIKTSGSPAWPDWKGIEADGAIVVLVGGTVLGGSEVWFEITITDRKIVLLILRMKMEH